jgi:hypothetical protein
MRDRLPETLEELCDWIHRYADSIFVRAEVAGKWGNHALSSLPAKEALAHAFRWIKEGRVPVRMLSEEEQRERKAGQS